MICIYPLEVPARFPCLDAVNPKPGRKVSLRVQVPNTNPYLPKTCTINYCYPRPKYPIIRYLLGPSGYGTVEPFHASGGRVSLLSRGHLRPLDPGPKVWRAWTAGQSVFTLQGFGANKGIYLYIGIL